MLSLEERIKLINGVKSDPGLSADKKAGLIDRMEQADFFDKLLKGAGGAAFSLLLSKWMAMSKSSQLLMAIAGAGIGVLLFERSTNVDNWIHWDAKAKGYRVK